MIDSGAASVGRISSWKVKLETEQDVAERTTRISKEVKCLCIKLPLIISCDVNQKTYLGRKSGHILSGNKPLQTIPGTNIR
jgi:hypothetical protein